MASFACYKSVKNLSTITSYISLATYAERIRSAIEDRVESQQWVAAEVSSVQVNHSGHCYLELVERTHGEQLPRAVCRAVIWGSRFKIISAYFRHQTSSDIVVGMKILVNCTATYHPVYGLSLAVNDIDPTYTIGEVERVRQQTISRLKSEGVFDMNREFALARVVQRVAVVSSATAAGYGDFCDELARSAYRFDVTLFQATMQGEGAESSIISALEDASSGDYDALIIIRGGGSVSDLACFDSYELCDNIAQFPLPVITGIGHERDTSVADMVACQSLKTPTAVAAFMIERAAAFDQRLDKAQQYLMQKTMQILVAESQKIENVSLLLQNLVGTCIHDNLMGLSNIESRLTFAATALITRMAVHCDKMADMMKDRARIQLENQIKYHNQITATLRQASSTILTIENHRLEILSIGVETANPRRILKRGYAIVNQGARSVEQLSVGDNMTVELADGIITAKIVEKWQTKS